MNTNKQALTQSLKRNISHFKRLIHEHPDDLNAHILLGTVYLNNNDFSQAEQYFRQAQTLDPDSWRPKHSLARVLEEKRDFESSSRLYLENLLDACPQLKYTSMSDRVSIARGGIDPDNAIQKMVGRKVRTNTQLRKSLYGLTRVIKQTSEQNQHNILQNIQDNIADIPEVLLSITADLNEQIDFRPTPRNYATDITDLLEPIVDELQTNGKIIDGDPGYNALLNSSIQPGLISRIYRDFGDWQNAIEVLKKGVESAKEQVLFSPYLSNVESLAETYRMTGQKEGLTQLIKDMLKEVELAHKGEYWTDQTNVAEKLDDIMDILIDNSLYYDKKAIEPLAGLLLDVKPSSLRKLGYEHVITRRTIKLWQIYGRNAQAEKTLDIFVKDLDRLKKKEKWDAYYDLGSDLLREYGWIDSKEKYQKLLQALVVDSQDYRRDISSPSRSFNFAFDIYLGMIDKRKTKHQEMPIDQVIQDLLREQSNTSEHFNLASALSDSIETLTDHDDYAAAESLMKDTLRRTMRDATIAQEDGLKSIVSIIQEKPNYFSDTFIHASLSDIESYIAQQEKEHGVGYAVRQMLELWSTLAETYATIGERDKAERAIEKIMNIHSANLSFEIKKDLFLQNKDIPITTIVSSILQKLYTSLGEYDKSMHYEQELSAIAKSDFEIEAVRTRWGKTAAQSRSEQIDREVSDLDWKLHEMRDKKNANKERADIVSKQTALYREKKKLQKKSVKIYQESFIREQVQKAEEIGRGMIGYALLAIAAGALNEGLQQYQELQKFAELCQFREGSALHVAESRAEILKEVLLRVQDSKTLRKLLEQDVLLDGYNVLDKIGAGFWGNVYLISEYGSSIDNPTEVAKIFYDDARKKEYADAVKKIGGMGALFKQMSDIEGSIAKSLSRRSYLKFGEGFEYIPLPLFIGHKDAIIGNKKTQALIYEYIKGPTLAKISSMNLDESELLLIIEKACYALNFAHINFGPHNDVKPDNFLASEDFHFVYVTDLGFSGINAINSKIKSSPLYAAPEVLRGAKPSIQSDIYSFGLLMHQVMTGSLPMSYAETGNDRKAFAEAIMSGAINPYERVTPNKAYKSVIRECLHPRPEDRYQSIHQLIEDLPYNHYMIRRD
jgi:tetratricopeptide (TPR) repeat protein